MQAGISWQRLSSHASEAANFGLFIGSQGNMKRSGIVSGFVGGAGTRGETHYCRGMAVTPGGWRIAIGNTLIGPFDFLDSGYPAPQHICESTYDPDSTRRVAAEQGTQ